MSSPSANVDTPSFPVGGTRAAAQEVEQILVDETNYDEDIEYVFSGDTEPGNPGPAVPITNGVYLVDYASNTLITIYDAVNYERMWRLKPTHFVQQAYFSPVSNYVLLVCYKDDDHYAHKQYGEVWHIPTGELRHRIDFGVDYDALVELSSLGNVLSVHNYEGDFPVIFWNLDTGCKLDSAIYGRFTGNGISFGGDDRYLICWNCDNDYYNTGKLRVLEFETMVEVNTVEAIAGCVSICSSPDGRFGAQFASARGIAVWELSTGRTFLSIADSPAICCFGPNSDSIFYVTKANDMLLKAWSVTEGSTIFEVSLGRIQGSPNLVICPQTGLVHVAVSDVPFCGHSTHLRRHNPITGEEVSRDRVNFRDNSLYAVRHVNILL
jgi:WD40 repeat protein